MALTKKTFVDQVTVDEDGVVFIRYKKAIMEDGKVISHQYHRTSCAPGDDLENQLDHVDNHLEAMGAGRPDLSERDLPRQIVAIAHTPEKIAARRQRDENLRNQMGVTNGQQPN